MTKHTTEALADGLRAGFERAGLTLAQKQIVCVDLANTLGLDPRELKAAAIGADAEREPEDTKPTLPIETVRRIFITVEDYIRQAEARAKAAYADPKKRPEQSYNLGREHAFMEAGSTVAGALAGMDSVAAR